MIERKNKKKVEITNKVNFSDDDYDEQPKGGSGDFNIKNSKSKTPMLDNFGRDLSKLGEEGKLDAIIGRDKEIERVSQILSRRKKNNPILIGEPGCVDGDTEITIRKVSNDKVHNIINI